MLCYMLDSAVVVKFLHCEYGLGAQTAEAPRAHLYALGRRNYRLPWSVPKLFDCSVNSGVASVLVARLSPSPRRVLVVSRTLQQARHKGLALVAGLACLLDLPSSKLASWLAELCLKSRPSPRGRRQLRFFTV
jgi:hypothetical protein